MQTDQVAEYGRFVESHGGRPIRINAAYSLLPDGAHIENSSGLGPSLMPPPTSALGQLQARRAYCVAFIEKAESAFAQNKAIILGKTFGNAVWPVPLFGELPSDAKRVLTQLRLIVYKHRKLLKAIDEKIAGLPEVTARREAKEQAERARAEQESAERAARAEVEAITLP